MCNYRIFFVHENCIVDVPQGTSILHAQRLAGLRPDAPCGGKGSCGKCIVEIRTNHSGEWRQALACQEIVKSSLEVRAPKAAAGMRILTDANEAAPARWKPWIQIEPISDRHADYPASAWRVVAPAGPLEYLSAEPEAYMAAFDIGTTTIAGYLIGLRERKTITVASMLNPQIEFGADVISRANYTLENGLTDPMRSVRSAVDALIGKMCADTHIARENIYAISIAGNTCMHHIFYGLELHSLVRAPYAPAMRKAMVLPAAQFEINVHPKAQLLLLPVIAGFVGADTVACLVSGDWQNRKPLTLLIDIGTNGEMVLGNFLRRIACSTAAGPALEGAKIQCGMRGVAGAIDHVWLEKGMLRWHVIGDGAAKGICGSGLIDLIAALLQNGDMDEMGKLRDASCISIGDTGVVLTQRDVRELQLAKAAIAAGIQLLMKKMGAALSDIEEVHIAGAFGSYMNPDSACAIGLIPAALRSKIHIVGNAAGNGAQRVLMDRNAWENAIALAENTEFLELASMPEFQDVFVDELEFPEAREE